MKYEPTAEDKDRRSKIEHLVDYVEAYKDSIETQRILSTMLNDHQLGPTVDDFEEFRARLGRASNEQLDDLLNMMGPETLTPPLNVRSRRETEFPE